MKTIKQTPPGTSTTAPSVYRKAVTPEFASTVKIAERVPMSPTLKSLKVGEAATFPMEQKSAVIATVYRIRKDYSRQGWDVQFLDPQPDCDPYSFTVKRVR